MTWLKSLSASGVPVKGLEDVPTLAPEAMFYWEAYVTLTVKRITNERGPQPIQMSEMLAYVNYMRIDDDILREDLFYMINTLDATYLDYVRKPRPGSNKRQAGGAKPGRQRR